MEVVATGKGSAPGRVLIAGGGVAALETALALRALAEDRVSIELLAPEPLFWYRPLAVAEPFQLGSTLHFGLPELTAAAGATFSLGSLAAVDVARQVAYTGAGSRIPYDALLIACGAVPGPTIPGALTFRGPADSERIGLLLAELETGDVDRVAFAVPSGAVWTLPIYELALLTSAWLAQRGVEDVKLALVTPEEAPLRVFGPNASEAVQKLLSERGISIYCDARPAEFRDGELLLVAGGAIPADRVVALPRLHGQRIDGITQTVDGFVPVDGHGRVLGLTGVFAAGDITTFPVKQGGVAAQQAESAAHTIAAQFGADIKPLRFRPVLRGFLLTGSEPRFLRRELRTGIDTVSPDPLWWPPAKIVGRYLAPFLGRMAGGAEAAELLPRPGVLSVNVELATSDSGSARPRTSADSSAQAGDGETVGEVMPAEFLTAGPDESLGDVAARMRQHDTGSALIVDEGRLVGILTSRDLLRAFAARAHPSEARVRAWMTAEPIAVSATTTLGAALFLMTEHNVHHLPVVDGEHPVGMVGMRDAARSAGRRLGIGLGF